MTDNYIPDLPLILPSSFPPNFMSSVLIVIIKSTYQSSLHRMIAAEVENSL